MSTKTRTINDPLLKLEFCVVTTGRKPYSMIIRLSQKLGKKIKATPSEVLPLDENQYADWSAHLFTADRLQYVIITNTASLYSTIMFGRGITDDSEFIKRALNSLHEFMEYDGQEFTYLRLVAPESATVRYSKALSRSVTGSMNDMIQCAKMWLVDEDLSPFDTSFKINEMPMSALKYANPREAFKALSNEEVASDNDKA